MLLVTVALLVAQLVWTDFGHFLANVQVSGQLKRHEQPVLLSMIGQMAILNQIRNNQVLWSPMLSGLTDAEGMALSK